MGIGTFPQTFPQTFFPRQLNISHPHIFSQAFPGHFHQEISSWTFSSDKLFFQIFCLTIPLSCLWFWGGILSDFSYVLKFGSFCHPVHVHVQSTLGLNWIDSGIAFYYFAAHSESKKLCHYTFVHNFDKCCPIFKIFFTVVFSKKFATKPLPHCPPHLRCFTLQKIKTQKFAKFCCI